jgi:hypothetical protein
MTPEGGASPRIGKGRLRPPVPSYHTVSDTWADPLAVSPAMFERHVRAVLGQGYRPTSATEESGRSRFCTSHSTTSFGVSPGVRSRLVRTRGVTRI